LDSARQLSQLPDQRAQGLLMIAAIQNDLGNAEEAIKAYQQTIEACPDGQGLQVPPEELFLQFGMALVNYGRGQEAVRWLERSLAARPTPAAYFHLGKAMANRDAAEQAWQKAVVLDPQDVLAREMLANTAIQKRDYEAALKWIAPVERVAEERYKTAFLFQRVHTLRKDEAAAQRWQQQAEELRQRDQRLGAVDELMRRSPHSFWANVARAHRFAASGNWLQAEDMLKELASQAPQDKFVQELAAAVRRRAPLPSLDQLPVR
jgi:tetratricopeptide (TPR) repeat protein